MILDGPKAYRDHYAIGWDQFLFEYPLKHGASLDFGFSCTPIALKMAEGDGYDRCKSEITALEKKHGRKTVLAAIQRAESSKDQVVGKRR